MRVFELQIFSSFPTFFELAVRSQKNMFKRKLLSSSGLAYAIADRLVLPAIRASD